MKINQFRFTPPAIQRQLTTFIAGGIAMGLLAAVMAGCATEPKSHTVSSPPPPAPTRSVTTTTTTTSPDTMPGTTVGNPSGVVVTRTTPIDYGPVTVSLAPPAPQSETVLAQPGSNYAWVPGYWSWRTDRYVWMSGHWEVPPNPGAVWVAPRWEQRGNAYQFTEGYWH